MSKKNNKRNVSIEEIEKDWKTIKVCSEQYITSKKMLAAIQQYPKSIQFFPASKLTKRIILQAVRNDYSILKIVPRHRDNGLAEAKQELLNTPSYIKYLIKYEKYKIFDKYYSKEEGFVIVLESRYRIYHKAFLSNFEDFAEALSNRFSKCNLLEFDFENVDYNKYNFDKAYISTKVLKKYEVFDDTYFNNVVKQTTIEDFLGDNSLVVYDENQELTDWKKIQISYISDIHLGHRIKNHFKKPVSRNEVYFYVKSLAKQLTNQETFYDWIIVDGDLGIDFEINKIFLSELSKDRSVIFVIGNHELFGLSKKYYDTFNLEYKIEHNDTNKYCVENRIAKYEMLCKKLGVYMLQNKAIVIKKSNSVDTLDLTNLNTLDQNQVKDIRKKYYDMEYAIFGTCGFSYLNKEFNYKNSLWEITAKEEKQEYIKANCAYNNLKLIFDDKKVFVATHTPITDWMSQGVNSNWIYINGHTHRNKVTINDEMQIYADNQIGYFNNLIRLKSISFDKPTVDIFFDYPDGLYNITRNQYLRFNQYQGISATFNRKCKNITMIKASGYYCFLVKASLSKKTKKRLYLLDGGKLKNIDSIAINDEEKIEIIKDNIFEYAKAINEITMRYGGYQKQVASFIKSIGGYGKVHGCIVDIDYPQGIFGVSYYHVYVNPNDGSLTYYYAQDISSREIYKDLPTLLKYNFPKALPRYNKYIKENKNLPIILNENNIVTNDFDFDEGTYIYKQSNMMRKLQYITENKIIRIWDDSIIDEYKSKKYLKDKSTKQIKT